MANDGKLTMNALEVKDVCRRYGGQEVLKNLSITLAEGEFVALMGASGSGKTTFLHLVAGLLAADSGRIFVGDCEITAMGDGAATKFRRRHIGVIFQSFNLLETATVAENIVLTAKLDHAKIDKERLAYLVSRLGLAGKEGKYPSELSGGERQRVAIARALYPKPDLILADEPTGNLDTKSSHEICAMLGELNRSEKCAILLVTHDPIVAASATRVSFLRDGAIAASFPTGGDAAFISSQYLKQDA